MTKKNILLKKRFNFAENTNIIIVLPLNLSQSVMQVHKPKILNWNWEMETNTVAPQLKQLNHRGIDWNIFSLILNCQ